MIPTTLLIDTWNTHAADLLGEHAGPTWAPRAEPLPFTVDGVYVHPDLEPERREALAAATPGLEMIEDDRAPTGGAAVRLQAITTEAPVRLRKVHYGSVRRARKIIAALQPVIRFATAWLVSSCKDGSEREYAAADRATSSGVARRTNDRAHRRFSRAATPLLPDRALYQQYRKIRSSVVAAIRGSPISTTCRPLSRSRVSRAATMGTSAAVA